MNRQYLSTAISWIVTTAIALAITILLRPSFWQALLIGIVWGVIEFVPACMYRVFAPSVKVLIEHYRGGWR